jgi:hypothetical protein
LAGRVTRIETDLRRGLPSSLIAPDFPTSNVYAFYLGNQERENPLEEQDIDGRIILGEVPVEGCYEHGDEPSM